MRVEYPRALPTTKNTRILVHIYISHTHSEATSLFNSQHAFSSLFVKLRCNLHVGACGVLAHVCFISSDVFAGQMRCPRVVELQGVSLQACGGCDSVALVRCAMGNARIFELQCSISNLRVRTREVVMVLMFPYL